MKPFDLEAFKAGQKALTRNGRVATFVGICEECPNNEKLIAHIDWSDTITTYSLDGTYYSRKASDDDLVSMVSRHQHLIDSYDPEDTWQWSRTGKNAWAADATPSWHEKIDYRLHPHNDLIKAWKKRAKIEAYIVGDWVEEPNPDWYEDTQYRIKPEPEFTYPIYKQSKHSNVVVEFTDLTTGKVLVSNNFYKVGHVQSTWIPHTDAAQWQDWTPITKPEPTIHCLAYDAKRFDLEQPRVVHARVVKKEVAEATGWKIIQEWEV